MFLGRYVVEAVLLEGRSPTKLARSHGISRSWVFELLKRYREAGDEGLKPRSRRPRSCPHQVSPEIQARIVELRHQLLLDGFDAGAQTIAHYLATDVDTVPAVSTIWRILSREGLVTPQPQKRPRASFTRFEAELPNQMWQADPTHWHLADGTDVEILNILDDHSRFCLCSTAHLTVNALDVVQSFHRAGSEYGYPESFLSDNGAVFSARYRKGKVLLESELERLGIRGKHSAPYHPQTCGKVERFHQTLKKFLARQAPAENLAHLQLQLDAFRVHYNQLRPHRALGGQTPLQAYHARLKARPEGVTEVTHFRVRHDRVSDNGTVTLRYLTRLHHVGLGRIYKRQPVLLMVAGNNVRVTHVDGTLIRELTLDPTRDYQPARAPTVDRDVARQESAMS